MWTDVATASAWFGQKKDRKKKWAWTDDSELNYTNWYDEEPYFVGEEDEKCGVLYVGTLSGGGWGVRPCDEQYRHAICKKPSYMSGL
ncbi:unnamed protein product [Toxocara canis]|uniref:C-type lectin domain-containing protein n=1 Tax=Toxocara canis TaxID=6265 RepID=A0A3P7FLC0_TOXCA|nr:unnamed protein product [Toxocara canis]